MKRIVLSGLAILLSCACAPGLPEYLAVDPDFTPDQRVALDDALAQFCDATGWCPRVVGRARAAVKLAEAGEYSKDPILHPGFHRAEDSDLYVSAVGLEHWGVAWWWTIFAHELGHYAIDNHPCPGRTLCSVAPEPVFALDWATISAFKRGARAL